MENNPAVVKIFHENHRWASHWSAWGKVRGSSKPFRFIICKPSNVSQCGRSTVSEHQQKGCTCINITSDLNKVQKRHETALQRMWNVWWRDYCGPTGRWAAVDGKWKMHHHTPHWRTEATDWLIGRAHTTVPVTDRQFFMLQLCAVLDINNGNICCIREDFLMACCWKIPLIVWK